MKTLIYNVDEEFYYVKELACSRCHWLSTKKLDEKPELPWVSHTYQYDGEYFRKARPFTFWKVKSGRSETVEDDHVLVRDYVDCSHSKRR